MAKGIDIFDETNKRVYLGTSSGTQTEYSVQEVWSLIKERIQIAPHIDLNAIATVSGFDLLPLGDRTGIVLILLDGWTLWTLDQGSNHQVRFAKGIISSSDGLTFPLGTPVNVTWLLAESTVSSLQNVDTLENMEHHIEKDSYAFGETYYWNPVNGDDGDDGKWENTARKTFASIHDNLVVAGNNDVVYCITPGVDGIVTITEKIDITKNNVHLRGQGNRHVIAPTVQGDAVRIHGSGASPILGVEFSGFRVEVPTIGANLDGPGNAGNQANIHLHWAYNTQIHNVHVMNGQTNGIQMHFSQNVIFDHLDIHENAGDGMFIWNSKNSQVTNCRIFNNAADGIKIQADSEWQGTPIPEWRVDNIIFHETKVYDNEGYSLDFITSGTTPTEILFDSTSWIGDSTLGRANTNDMDRADMHDNDIVNKLDLLVTNTHTGSAGGSGRTMSK